MTTKPLTKSQLGKHLEALRDLYFSAGYWRGSEIVYDIFTLLRYSYLSKAFVESVNAYERQGNPDFDYVTFKGDKKSGMTPDDLCEFHRKRLGFGFKVEHVFEHLLQNYPDPKKLFEVTNQVHQECHVQDHPHFVNLLLNDPKLVTDSPEQAKQAYDQIAKSVKTISALSAKLPLKQFGEVHEKFYALVQLLDAKTSQVIPEEIAQLIAQLAYIERPDATRIADPNPLAGTLLTHTAKAFRQTTQDIELYCTVQYSNVDLIAGNLLLSGNQYRRIFSDFFDHFVWPLNPAVPTNLDLVVSYLPVKYESDEEYVKFEQDPKTKSSLLRGIPCNRATAVSPLIAEILHHLDSDGVCFLLVPEGYLHDKADKAQRKFLLENNLVHAVINFPDKVFLPVQRTSLLVLKKNRTPADDKVMFIAGSGLSTELKTIDGSFSAMHKLLKSASTQIIKTYLSAKPKTDFCALVPVNDLLKKGVSLSVGEYFGIEKFKYPETTWHKDDYGVALGQRPKPEEPDSINNFQAEPYTLDSLSDFLETLDEF